MNKNIFFEKFETPFNTVPFDKIRLEDYKPAFLEGFKRHNEEIEQIVNNPSDPTFENTIECFERSGELLSVVQGVFYNILSAESTDEMQDLANELSPLETEHYNNINLNTKLFDRINKVYLKKESLGLTKEQARLLEKIYLSFVNNGALLSDDDKEKFRDLSKESALLQLKYGQNLLNSTNAFSKILGENELEGLPESCIESAKMRAKEKGMDGYLFDLSYPSYAPFMKYSKVRDLRRQLYMAYNSKSFGGEYDNVEIVKRLVNVRLQIANLLGFENFAEYVLKTRMAHDSRSVYKLLDDLFEAYEPVAIQEVSDIKMEAAEDGLSELMPWDWSYYSDRLKNKRFSINDEIVRPYLSLEKVKDGVLGLATDLYAIEFKRNLDIPVYHKEVEAYEVLDESGKHLAVLYMDFFPRAGKQSGAWMTEFRCQHRNEKGEDVRPHVSIVMNFSRPTDTKPSLLSIDELTTFLHEFGHALHGILSKVSYESLAGTNVYRDFVELPSQIMENWATEKEFLDKFAKHYKTGEIIPFDIISKIKAEYNFNVGYATLRQLSFGYLDMAWHTIKTAFDGSVKEFESKAWKKTLLLPEIDGTMMSSQFSHIFDGGYAAGYYGYKWAEVLDADAFLMFKENGIFDKTTARRFRTEILEKGSTEDPLDLFKAFRGEEPSISALLERTGLVK